MDKGCKLPTVKLSQVTGSIKTLQTFKTVLQGKVVQVLSDNITTVSYINSLGGPNPLMTQLMKVIFTHVHENQMVLLAKFLARSRNCHTDRLSRNYPHTNGKFIPNCSNGWARDGDHIQWIDLPWR